MSLKQDGGQGSSDIHAVPRSPLDNTIFDIKSLPQTLIFLSQYLYNPMPLTLNILNYEFTCRSNNLGLKYQRSKYPKKRMSFQVLIFPWFCHANLNLFCFAMNVNIQSFYCKLETRKF